MTTPSSSDSGRPDQDSAPVRFNDTLLAPQERRLLQWIARKLPTAATPDRLTVLGVLGALIVLAGYLLSERTSTWLWLANLGLLVHWLGDSLDGTIARLRKIERPRYGFYLDQVIDTLGNTIIAIGVGLAPWVRMDTVLIVLALYHMLSIQVYVRAIVDREFHLAVGRLGPTELRLGILGLNCVILCIGEPKMFSSFKYITWVDVLVGLLALGLAALYGVQMKQHLTRLAIEDPPRDHS